MERITTLAQLEEAIDRIGFLPYAGDEKKSLFTLESMTDNAWFTGLDSDPWEWRRAIAEKGEQAYGKFFGGKAGFVSKECIPAFIAARRDNRSFEELYADGLISRDAKRVWEQFSMRFIWTHQELKAAAGFDGQSRAFDAALGELQGLFFLCVPGQSRRINKKGEPYGWLCNDFARMDVLFPVEEDDEMQREEGEEYLMDCIRAMGEFDEKAARRLIRAGGII